MNRSAKKPITTLGHARERLQDRLEEPPARAGDAYSER